MDINFIAGIDEAGRGPLAGPVVAAAVILDPQKPIIGLNDSKKLSAIKREELFLKIKTHAIAWSFAQIEADEIDRINILQATLLAMQYAVAKLNVVPTLALIDGNQAPRLFCPTETIIRGDQLEPAISAASIVAKVIRDQEMVRLDKLFSCYGFANHKGYPTAAHLKLLKQYGPCVLHRRSFAPVRAVENQ
jgi:ribonuclease HII